MRNDSVDTADNLAIILALNKGQKLEIDRYGHIYDIKGRWIPDGMKRFKKALDNIEYR